ncbi:hypothetical protein CSC04_0038 [Enterobacter roggenkampii]|nr:hypothetical protein CSC04_0038 [Enterobacter roggenkampii]
MHMNKKVTTNVPPVSGIKRIRAFADRDKISPKCRRQLSGVLKTLKSVKMISLHSVLVMGCHGIM